jgi:hypothetical protein
MSFTAPAMAQSGSYQGSCRNTSSSNGVLSAECSDGQGNWRQSSINSGQCRGDIGNNHGMLACNGATATGGSIVSGNSNNERRGNNNGNVAGAAAAGVVAGALLGGALGGNGGPTIVYGDPHYGDPRYDPHYAQGGWGYGHRPGEWVPIRDRAHWLDDRIDRAVRDGRIGRRDAQDLRQQLNFIQDEEGRYMRDGRLDGRERADLDRRFDDLQRRISYEEGGPPGPPPPRDRRY